MKALSLLLPALLASGWLLLSNSEELARKDEPHPKNVRQLTQGGENAEAYFSTLEERLIFQSTRSFDAFPMFSRDGRKLVFASNRNARERGETNIFIADWIP